MTLCAIHLARGERAPASAHFFFVTPTRRWSENRCTACAVEVLERKCYPSCEWTCARLGHDDGSDCPAQGGIYDEVPMATTGVHGSMTQGTQA